MPIYQNNKKNRLKRKTQLNKKIGITLVCVFSVLLLNLLVNFIKPLNNFFLGFFGLCTYAYFLIAITIGVLLIANKKEINITKKGLILFICFILCFFAMLHTITSKNLVNELSSYLTKSYNTKTTAGGLLFSLICYPILYLTHHVGTIVIWAILLILIGAGLIDEIYSIYKFRKLNLNKIADSNTIASNTDDEIIEESTQKEKKKKSILFNEDNDDIFIPDDIEEDEVNKESDKDKKLAKKILGISKSEDIEEIDESDERMDIFKATDDKYVNSYSESYIQNKSNGKPPKIIHNFDDEEDNTFDLSSKRQNIRRMNNIESTTQISKTKPIQKTREEIEKEERLKKNKEFLRSTFGTDNSNIYDENFTLKDFNKNQKEIAKNINNVNNAYSSLERTRNKNEIFISSNDTEFNENINNRNNSYHSNNNFNKNNNFNARNNFNNGIEEENSRLNNNNSRYNNSFNDQNNFNEHFEDNFEINQQDIREIKSLNRNFENRNTYNQEQNFNRNNNQSFERKSISQPEKIENNNRSAIEKEFNKPKRPYVKPPFNLLRESISKNDESLEEVSSKSEMLESMLSNFKIDAKVTSVTRGPTFTQYELQMPPGISVNRINQYSNDFAMYLQSSGSVRLEIPIPNKNAFGIEVPNNHRDVVAIKDVIESMDFEKSGSPLSFALGKDISGENIIAKLEKMPHLLVAGSTGSGKSVCLNSIIISMLYKASPDDVRFILIDPKQIEFTVYNKLPHLLVPNVITSVDQAINSLDWLVNEMERRYSLLREVNARDMSEYNQSQKVKDGELEKLPYIVLIIDELMDLMVQAKKDIEDNISRLTAKSRAAGIHLILATQRPSTNVITGVIKANLPTRIAFAVTSMVDSKVILDQGGAEKLLGMGDMLYYKSPEMKRLQGVLVTSEEVLNVVNFIKENNDTDFDSDLEEKMLYKKQPGFEVDSTPKEDMDPLMKDALRLVIKTNYCSISKFQRSFCIGYPRAGKLVDQMEKFGFVSPPDSKNNRVIYITQQEFEERFGEDL